MSNNEAFASAVERAKQILTKISDEPSTNTNNHNSNVGVAGMKRVAEDNGQYAFEKRPFMNDKSSAAAAAAEAVARLNQKIGSQTMQQPPSNQPPQPQLPFPSANGNNGNHNPGAITVNWSIPDRYVGLVIGKRGEQITNLQYETDCKVQISQEGGRPERPITLIGTDQQIEKAQARIQEIINGAERLNADRANNAGPMHHAAAAQGGFVNIELKIPGNKAGLIIGKGGETIKNLQEEHGVKMVLIQQTNVATMEEKPLRISGDPQRVDRVRQIILDLINARTNVGAGGVVKPSYGEGIESTQYAVPAEKAGLVIGKGGESIKDICRVSNCHVEICKDPSPDPSIKVFNLRGTLTEIDQAIRMISDRAGIPPTRTPNAIPAQTGYNNYAYVQDPNAAAYGANGGMPAPSYNPYTGQPDYSAAWIEYYRRLGMTDQADAIQRQCAQQAAAAGQPGLGSPGYGAAAAAAAAPQHPQGGAGAAGGGQIDYAQWQQWQQWQAWQHSWQQGGGANPGGAVPPTGQSN